jgi:hypothetical protein
MKPTKYDFADSNIVGLGTDLEKQVKLKAAQTEAGIGARLSNPSLEIYWHRSWDCCLEN